MSVLKFFGTFARAIFAGLTMFVGATGAFLVNDTTLGDISDGQWFYIAGVTLTAFAGVFGFVNSKPK